MRLPILLHYNKIVFVKVAKLCPTLSDHLDCSMPDFLVLHCLPEFAQIHVL